MYSKGGKGSKGNKGGKGPAFGLNNQQAFVPANVPQLPQLLGSIGQPSIENEWPSFDDWNGHENYQNYYNPSAMFMGSVTRMPKSSREEAPKEEEGETEFTVVRQKGKRKFVKTTIFDEAIHTANSARQVDGNSKDKVAQQSKVLKENEESKDKVDGKSKDQADGNPKDKADTKNKR